MFKGPRLGAEKEGVVAADLAAWQADGRALFPVWFIMLYGSVWLPLMGCTKLGLLQRGPFVLKFALFPEGPLVPCWHRSLPIWSPFYSLVFHPSPSTLTLLLPWPLFLAHLFPFGGRATTGNNGCSHSFSHRQPCPGLADSTALHGSGAKPNLTREEEVETVSREEGICSHQGESQCAQSVGVWLTRERKERIILVYCCFFPSFLDSLFGGVYSWAWRGLLFK